MTEQINTNICGHCYHDKSSHHDGVCMGDLSCHCFTFVENELYNLALEVEKAKLTIKSIEKRCKFLLEKIPQLRNAGEKSFYKVFIEFWYGFKIRKGEPSKMDTDTWKRLPNQDTVNRAKRKVKQHNDDLKTYDPETLRKQEVMFQAITEWVSDV